MAERVKAYLIKEQGLINITGLPIKVLVGEEEKPFYVHREPLRMHSSFFRAALKEEWLEGKYRVVKLPAEDPTPFESYVQWLYTGKINCDLSNPEAKETYSDLAALYVLGERLIDSIFQDRIVDLIVATSRTTGKDDSRWYPTNIVNTIYENTTSKSPLRCLLMDFFVGVGNAEWIDDETYNNEFLSDLAKSLMNCCEITYYNKERFQHLESGHPCAYHNHDKDKPCDGQSA